jgi:hypothetical protein
VIIGVVLFKVVLLVEPVIAKATIPRLHTMPHGIGVLPRGMGPAGEVLAARVTLSHVDYVMRRRRLFRVLDNGGGGGDGGDDGDGDGTNEPTEEVLNVGVSFRRAAASIIIVARS